MKLKGINPLEQHVEKAVIGVLGLGLIGVVGWQFLFPTTINVGKKEVGVADAYRPAEDAARAAKGEVDNPSPKFPPAPDTTPLTQFGKLARADISKPGKLPSLGPALALGATAGTTVSGDAMYAALAVPAPSKIWAVPFRGTIDPAEKVSIEGLAALLPKEQPYDKAAVSIEAAFDGRAFKALLTGDPDGPGPLSALPTDWWSNKVEIIGVQVEREEKSETGSWGNGKVLPMIPGRVDFIKEWNEKVKAGGDAPALVEQASKDAEQIQRPAFYDMIVGNWRKPSSVTNLNFNQAAYDVLAEQFKELQKQLAEKEQELANVPKDDPNKKNNDPGPAPSGGGGGGGGGSSKGASGAGGGGGGGAAPTPSQPEKKEETNAAKRARLQREINTTKAKIEETRKRIVEMGGEIPGAHDAAVGVDQVPGADRKERTIDNPDVRVYAHDMTAEPGKIYRYRVRVVFNNPFFGKDIMLKDGDAAQKALAQSSLVMGEWSTWSPDTYVLRDAYWFVTSAAQDPLRQNMVRASAELYQFYYGHYRRAEVSLEPGDALVGEAKLPKLYIYDEKKLADADPSNPAPVADPGGGKGGKGGRAPNAPDQGPKPEANPTPDQPPAGSTPAKTKLTFTDTGEVVLLDVKSPAGVSEKMQVVVRTFGGVIVIKSPEADRGSDEYKRVAADAEAGVAQGQPKIQPKPKPKPNGRPDDEGSGRGGGKGAGGGGGGGGG